MKSGKSNSLAVDDLREVANATSPDAMSSPRNILPYTGRFAPSPTGPLHFGSLVTALASYLDAKAEGGTWLVRMEDIDPPRQMPGAEDTILRQLEAHNLLWDKQLLYQSGRTEAYLAALERLTCADLAYPCHCSRQALQSTGGLHMHRCVSKYPDHPHALRLAVPENCSIEFTDLFQGRQQQRVKETSGDFVLLRKDDLFAYQLAVVIDDAHQGINHIVRGSDLLDSTARQIYLQQMLTLPTPTYGHLPIAVDGQGQKLSKQNLAPPVANHLAADNLIAAMRWLGMHPPPDLIGANPHELTDWGIRSWRRTQLPRMIQIPVPAL